MEQQALHHPEIVTPPRTQEGTPSLLTIERPAQSFLVFAQEEKLAATVAEVFCDVTAAPRYRVKDECGSVVDGPPSDRQGD